MAKILLLQGPNLNLLGQRETSLYGNESLDTLHQRLTKHVEQAGHQLMTVQSNAEHELINAIQQAKDDGVAFIIINPAAYTHTSIALRDALLAVEIPFIEVHISNIYAREPFRRHSYFSDIAVGVVSGFGTQSYEFAIAKAIATI